MGKSKGVTLQQKIWWKQLITRVLNRILGLPKILTWNFVKVEVIQFLALLLMLFPAIILGLNYFQYSKIIISPLLLMCFVCGVICFRTFSKEA